MALMINNDKRKLNGLNKRTYAKIISISKRIIKRKKKIKSPKRKKKLNSNLVGHSNLFRCPLHVVGTLDMALIFDH